MYKYDDYNDYEEVVDIEAVVNSLYNMLDIPIKLIVANPDNFIQKYIYVNTELNNLIIGAVNRDAQINTTSLQKIQLIQNLSQFIAYKAYQEYKNLNADDIKKIIAYTLNTLQNKLFDYYQAKN